MKRHRNTKVTAARFLIAAVLSASLCYQLSSSRPSTESKRDRLLRIAGVADPVNQWAELNSFLLDYYSFFVLRRFGERVPLTNDWDIDMQSRTGGSANLVSRLGEKRTLAPLMKAGVLYSIQKDGSIVEVNAPSDSEVLICVAASKLLFIFPAEEDQVVSQLDIESP